ncbi:MAG: hypothetical protein ABIG84_01515, partial [archaeon]
VDIRCNATDDYDSTAYFNPPGTITIDNTKPTFSDDKRYPDPPNEEQDLEINITIAEIRIDKVILEWNGTTNYTITTNSSNEYYFTIIPGNYTAHDTLTYRWFANDTLNNNNFSSIQQFTVANQIPTITITEPDGVDDKTTDTYIITWNAQDSDDEDTLTISCYGDIDNTGLDKTYTCFEDTPDDSSEICDMSSWVSDTYYIWCNASDSYSYFTNYSIGEILVDNTNPTISGETNTSVPNEDETIQINATITDSQSQIDTVWVRVTLNDSVFNNYTVSENTSTEYHITLTSSNYTAHDNVTWQYFANDSLGNIGNGTIIRFTVKNQIPTINPQPYLNDTIPRTNDVLNCTNGNFNDNDQEDSEQNREYRWYNNTEIIAGQNGLTLDLSTPGLGKGATINCSVRVFDTYEWSTWYNSSNTATIENTPPTAPATINMQPAGAVYTNTTITCSAGGSTDDDNDPITYYYKFNKTAGTLQDWSTTDTYDCNSPGCDKEDTTFCWAKATTSDANSSLVSDSEVVLNSDPQIILLTPTDHDYRRNIFNFTYNITDADGISDVDYCELWKDNGTGWTLLYNETMPQLTNNVTYAVGPGQHIEDIEWYVNCTDMSLAEIKSTQYKVYIDNVNPVPHFYYPEADNSTVQPDWNDTFNMDVRAENDHLIEVNLTIRNSTGYIVHQNLSGIISDSETYIEWYNMTYPIDITSWLPGNYTMMMNASDYAGNSGSWVRRFRINDRPTMTGVTITQSVVANGQPVNITTQNADDNDGDPYVLRCGSSSESEDLCNSASTPAGTEATCGFINAWTDTGTHTIYCRLDDSYDNSTEYTDTVDADNSPPQFSNLGINDTDIKVNDSVLFYAFWSDIGSAGLQTYTFSWNDSGVWTNTTAGLTEWSNITKSVFSTQGKDIGWIIYANDSVGNTNSTGIQVFTVNNTLPAVSPAQFNTSVFYIGDSITCNSTITDADFDSLTVTYDIWDQTKSEAAPNYNESNNGAPAQNTDTYTATVNNVVGAKGMWTCRFHVYDGTDTVDSANDTATVPNTPPTIPTTLTPTTGLYGGDNYTITINCSGSTDPNSEDTVKYNIETNRTGTWQSLNTSDPDGIYDWDISSYPSASGVDIRCNATDSYDESPYFNPPGTITIDNSPPVIANTFPPNNAYFNYAPPLNGTCTDNTNIEIIWTNSSAYTNIITTSPYSFANTSPMADQRYDIRITCNDTLNNTAYTDIWFTYDNIPPKMEFVYPTPEKNANISQNYSYLNWTIEEQNIHTTIISWNGTNTTMSVNYINKTDLADGVYTYYLWINDSAGNVNQTETRTLTIDTTSPNINILYPTNDTWYNTSTLNLTFYVEDNIDTLIECNRTIDNINEYLGLIPDETQNTTIMASLSELNHYANITCIDDTKNTKTSDTILFKIDTIPPATSDNITSDWKDNNQTILLSCSDAASGCNTTMYCIDDETNDCTPDMTGNLPEFTCLQYSICKGYIRYRSNDTAGNYEVTKNTTLIRIDTTLPAISNCTSAPYMIDNDTKTSISIETSCFVNSSGSGVKSVELITEQPYGTILNQTIMDTIQCSTPEPEKHCAFYNPNTTTGIGKLYFHINATNNINNSNYYQNATISVIDDLLLIYNITSIKPAYYSFQNIEPIVNIYFQANNSLVDSANATIELKNATSTINSTASNITNGHANASFYLGCIDETETMYLNTSAEFSVLSESNTTQQFDVSPLTTKVDCWFEQTSGIINIYCTYNDTINNAYIGYANLLLNISLTGTCNVENAIMNYNPAKSRYNYTCDPLNSQTYCSIPLSVIGQKSCYEESNYSADATTTIGINVNAYFAPNSIHTMEYTTLWMNITSTDSDANGVNVSISQTGGPSIYGPWSIIDNHYTLGTLVKDNPKIVNSGISVPSREQIGNYTVDVTISWNNTNCNGINTTTSQDLKILESYYVDFVNMSINKKKLTTGDILVVDGTIENIGNVPVSGNLSGSIVDHIGNKVGTLACNVTEPSIAFNNNIDIECNWRVVGPERGITTGEYRIWLRFDSPQVSLLYEEDIEIIIQEQTPKNKNVYVTRYPITVIDRYGRTSQRIVKIYTWME